MYFYKSMKALNRLKKKQFLWQIGVGACFFISLALPAQQTVDYVLQDDFRKGIELFNKQKYTAAQHFFEQSLSDQRKDFSLQKTSAEYYHALCAIYLHQQNAELLVESFLLRHPESVLKTALCFEMGKFLYDEKKYRQAVQYFQKTDKNELEPDEKTEYYFKSGYSWFMIDSLDKARLAFYEIKDIDNRYSSAATYYYGHIAYQQKNYETALQSFLKLVKDETFSSIVPYYITQCYYFQRKYDDLIAYAVPRLDSATKGRAGEMAKLIADAFYFKEQYKEALPFYEKYLAGSQGTGGEEAYQIGFCYYKNQFYKEAVKYFEKASIGDSKTAQYALYHLADCYLRTGNKKGARMAFEGAARMDYDEKIKEDALFNYALVTYELSYSPFNEGIRAFNEYISRYPTSERSDEAYHYLTLAYLNTRNYKDALAYIEKIKIKDNNLRKAYQRIAYFRAMELFNEQRYREAIQLLNTSLSYGEYDALLKANAYYWIGEACYRMNNTDEALSYYHLFLNSPSAPKSEEYATAHYNIGYIYFNQQKYAEAAGWFSKYMGLSGDIKTEVTADACNRLGDCFFERKDYTQALEYYTRAITIGKSGKDYAVFQKGFTLGLLGKYDQKISYLNQLVVEFPSSSYADEAIYEIGNTYLVLQKNTLAIEYFKKVISSYPSSNYVRKARLQLGIIYYNQDKYDDALVYYKQLVEEYPGTPEASNALTGIKNIYIEKKDADGYIQYVKGLGRAITVSDSEQDSLAYIVAENLYMNGDCQMSVEHFNKYLQRFPEGNFVVNAYFYKAECLNRQGQKDQALEAYEMVLKKNRNNFTESALLAAGRIYMENKNYPQAAACYVRLEEIAELPATIAEARINLVKAYYEMQEYANVIAVAKRLLPSEKLPPEEIRKARYCLAKAYLATNSIVLAQEELKKLSQEVKSPEAAEASYLLAETYFTQREYAKAETEIFSFAEKSTPHQYWVAKAFILLADIYLQRKDDFQASQTLRSVIENYANPDDGIIETAKNKLMSIRQQATSSARTDTSEVHIQLK